MFVDVVGGAGADLDVLEGRVIEEDLGFGFVFLPSVAVPPSTTMDGGEGGGDADSDSCVGSEALRDIRTTGSELLREAFAENLLAEDRL